jgi:hypothetical protein
MSAGAFVREIYEADSGSFHAIRCQPETTLLTDGTTVNDGGAGPIDSTQPAKITRSSREYGLKPRTITFEFDDGQAPTGYENRAQVTLPVLTPAAYAAYTAAPRIALTYLGGTGIVVNQANEDINNP